MKKELVIIAGSCYPVNSATGGLALNCAKYLHEYFNIRIISVQENGNDAEEYDLEYAKLYAVTQWRLKWAQKSKNKFNATSGITKKISYSSYQLARIIGRIQSTFFTLDNCSWYSEKALNILDSLNSRKKIDVIISFNAPIESHLAAEKFKKKNPGIEWISYWADLFAAKTTTNNIFFDINRLKGIELRLLSNSDKIMCTEEILQEFNNRYDNNILNKTLAIPYSLKSDIVNQNCYKPIIDGERIQFVYMGSLYRKIRNPERMLKAFLLLPDNCILDLYITGDCDDIVQKYEKLSAGRIRIHPTVTNNELEAILKKSHILVNIENDVATSNPSKLVELISYRKPILNFQSRVHNGFLDNYPYAIEIKAEGDLNNMMDSLLDRISKFDYTIDPIQKYDRYSEWNTSQMLIRHVIGL